MREEARTTGQKGEVGRGAWEERGWVGELGGLGRLLAWPSCGAGFSGNPEGGFLTC